MDLNAVKIFAKTAELSSFTKAATAVKMTQSGVSRAVSRLEEDLGVKLMNRTTRGLNLTHDGQAFFERCSLLLEELEEAKQQLIGRQAQPSGHLKISSPHGFGKLILSPAVARLSEKNPDLIVETTLTDRLVDLIAEGYDAAIRVGQIPDSRVVAKHLGTIRLVTIASPTYLNKFGTPRTPGDLAQHNCLNMRLPRTGRLYEWRFIEDGHERKFSVTGNIILDSGDALVDLAVRGHGITQAQSFMVTQALDNKQVVPVLSAYAANRGPISLIYPQSRQLSSKIGALTKALKNLNF